MNKRMDRSKLIIGTYILQPYARTEQHVRDLADCGIDLVTYMDYDKNTLDLFKKYNIGASVVGILPPWWGGNGENAGKMEQLNSFERYVEAAKSFKDHPAVWAIDMGDEPSALDFPYYNKLINFTDRAFENQFPYLNLYPNYASVAENTADQVTSQLGTRTYREHIEKYCENVPTDYICYDFYMYSNDSDISPTDVAHAYENLVTVSDACRNTGRSMWIVLQVNSRLPDRFTTENQLRFQAYSAMAFGAESIIWACWTGGWWHNQVLDRNGEKTEQYEKLKTVNRELHAIGERYMKYRRTSTHFVGFGDSHSDLRLIDLKPLCSLSTGVFFDVHEKNGSPIVIGQMVSRKGDGSYALMICASDDSRDKDTKINTVTFRAPYRQIILSDGNGERALAADENGYFSFNLPSCHGALIVAG
ncbi:MAG: hypothetical protein IKB34_06305 [Clostridia bacterium]|nr:hypothetical protein [Clostridia bacterium]